ncbi:MULTISPECIES: DUF2267 domain-containing protein [unclassified Mesorhizobium]|uniref:DUF2267 domain-containing protein n=1 Tax=unclassified Mesorhizobium TaxID=325217 RepID=UPI00313E4064
MLMCVSRDLNNALQGAHNWISDLAWRLRWHDREQVYQVLIATLHALRDCVDRDQAVSLGAQLPALLRGFYYEGWHPARRTIIRSRNSFLDRIHVGDHSDPALDPEEVARSILAQFADRMTAAKIDDAKAATPAMLRDLWPI